MLFQRPQLWPVVILIAVVLVTGCTATATTPEAVVFSSPPPADTATPVPTTSAALNTATPTLFVVPTLIPTPTSTSTVTPTPTATPPSRTVAPAAEGIWISPEELSVLPMEGRAWERLEAAADGELEVPNMAGYTANHDVETLAVALVYARTGEEAYREKAAQAIRATMGTEYTGLQKGPGSEQGALAVIVGRNLVSYVIAADLIDLSGYDRQLDAEFRSWIEGLLHEEWGDGSLVSEDERRANNHGRMAGGSRAAVAVYLGDQEELSRTAMIFKGFLGDRGIYTGFEFDEDVSWQADPALPVGINPPGSVKEGFVIDGALPEEMRRGCSFQDPPCQTSYPWESLQGVVVEANILHRQGFDVWNWEDQAILRSVQFMYGLQQSYPDTAWWAEGDDTWVPWLINYVYGTDFPTEVARIGKNMSWTDWTHAPATADAEEEPQ